MLLESAKLSQNLYTESALECASTRDGFAEAIVELGREDARVVVLSADVSASVKADGFKLAFPERYVEVGVSEQNMAGIASGLANYGKIPFMTAYAIFSPGRNWEQIRTTIALADLPVKIMGMHGGISVGEDGASHQALEDITLMRVVPNMEVYVPCDKEEARKTVRAVARSGSPAYVRFSRHNSPIFTTRETPFELGKAEYFFRSREPKVALLGTGPLVYDALLAARILEGEGIGTSVLNMHSIKPMDIPRVLEAVRDAGAVVSIEDHQILGGLGGTVAEVLTQNHPVPQEMVAIHDVFGQSGSAEELFVHYNLSVEGILEAARRVFRRAHQR